MNKGTFIPKQLHLVLIGGGHAQIQVLKSFAMTPLDGLAITLITDVLNAPYSGMVPGHIEGVWSKSDIHIDLARLASFAGATLIHDSVTNIDPERQVISLDKRPDISYDILSLNSGAVPELSHIQGAENHSIAVKPIAHFLEKLPEKLPKYQPLNIIGAGVAGLELAFAFKRKYIAQDPEIHIFSRSSSIVPTLPKKASATLAKIAKTQGISLHYNQAITALDSHYLTSEDGQRYVSGLNFIVTGVKPSPFVASLDKALDETGFLSVNAHLQSPCYPAIFAAGDVASFRHDRREKAGVFAVRAGPILAENLRRFCENKPLKTYRPQKRYLSLIGTGNGKALAVRGRFVMYHRLFWSLKLFIDKAFMQNFSDLPAMKAKPPSILPRYQMAGHDITDPIFKEMRCAGCAAKASASLLTRAMKAAIENAAAAGVAADRLPSADELGEDAGLTKAMPHDLRHSYDSLSQMVSDPYIFAEIAVNHALSDLFVAGARPLYAQAHINLQEASEPYQEMVATQLLTASLIALDNAGAQLIGGHTSQSQQASLGFAVTGAQESQFSSYEPKTDYHLVMSKALGTGIALAAHMRQELSAQAYEATIHSMRLSNHFMAQSCLSAGAIAMTDITGFGLARHCLNLLSRFGKEYGASLSLSALQPLAGLDADLIRKATSSLHAQNIKASPILATPSAADDWRLPLLFDPQTSGGVLAIMPADKTNALLTKITQTQPEAMPQIIGRLTPQQAGLKIEV